MLRAAAVLAAILLMSPADAARRTVGADRAAAPARPVADLAWMAGSWAGSQDGVEMEEHWTAPKGGAMLGLHRDVKGGRMISFEFARIEERPDGLVFLASPAGRPATPFRLVSLEGRRAVFENPEHDFPRRVIYWLERDGSLGARIEGREGGADRAMEWRWAPSSLR